MSIAEFPLITLTTDFGNRDPYVAEMKGVILQISPQATIVDISHEIHPQQIEHGAFVLGKAFPFFPQGAIHVTVVDPGVGTSRRPVLLTTPEGLFLAPDNGVLTYVLRDEPEYRRVEEKLGFLEATEMRLPPRYKAYHLSNPSLWRSPVSDTFHGRDVFAPVAAHLSVGLPFGEVGESVDSLVCLCVPHPRRTGTTVMGHVIYVDRFGNLVTTIEGDGLPRGKVGVQIKGHYIDGLSRSYAHGPTHLALIGSHGSLEIAARNGNAALELGADVGDAVVVELPPSV